MTKIFKDKTILITGGTGSFGKGFVRFLLDNAKPRKIIIFSRDELKQFQMQQELRGYEKTLRFFLGDVRDLARLQRAFHKVDIVIHAAALKQVPALEFNPFEAIQTNILGSQNVINAAIDQAVSKVLLISTDKAAEPINLYGATKMCAEKVFVASNAYAPGKCILSAVRYGNVLGSRGSIVETLLNSKEGPVHITHEEMTRFWLTLDSTYQLVLFALNNMVGGEIFVPKVPSMRLVDLFKALVPGRELKIVGIRPGEKLHETLVTEEEAIRGYDLGKYFVILPNVNFGHYNLSGFNKYKKGKKLEHGFRFKSDTNGEWLDHKDIKRLLKIAK